MLTFEQDTSRPLDLLVVVEDSPAMAGLDAMVRERLSAAMEVLAGELVRPTSAW